jgi:hypothetical protein
LQCCITVRACAILGCSCGLNSYPVCLDLSLKLLLHARTLIVGFSCGSRRCITLRTRAILGFLGCLCRGGSCLPRLNFSL